MRRWIFWLALVISITGTIFVWADIYQNAQQQAVEIGKETLTFPLEQVKEIYCGFFGYISPKGTPHGGNDYTTIGETVVAADKGIAVKIIDGLDNTYPNQYIYGNCVYLLHDSGLMTIYGHLQKGEIYVHQGEKIARGQPLAKSDNSGYSSGPHLHFEVTVGSIVQDGVYISKGTPVDPYSKLWKYGQPTVCKWDGKKPVQAIISVKPPGKKFYLVSTAPANQDKEVDCTADLAIEFSQAVDLNSLNNSIELTPQPVVPPLFFRQDINNQRVIMSGQLFSANTKYTLTLMRTIKNEAGEELYNSHSFSFTTANWPIVPKPQEPSTLVSTGPSTQMPNYEKYQECEIVAQWDVKKEFDNCSDLSVRDLICDNQNNIWVATSMGLAKYDRNGNCLKVLREFQFKGHQVNNPSFYAFACYENKIAAITEFYCYGYTYRKILYLDLSNDSNQVYFIGDQDDKGFELGKICGIYFDVGLTYNFLGELFEYERFPLIGDMQTSDGKVTGLRLQKFSANGSHIVSINFKPYISLPKAIDCDSNNNIYVADLDLRSVIKLDPNGKFLSSYQLPAIGKGFMIDFPSVKCLCVDRFDHIFALDDRKHLYILDSKLNLINGSYGIIKDNCNGSKIAIDKTGVIFTCDQKKVYKIMPKK